MRPISEIAKQILQDRVLAGTFLWRLPAGADVALTFDDGPDPVHTPLVLDVLAEHGVKATFFVVGERAEKSHTLLRRILEEGHALASHTQTHRELPTLSRAEMEWELGTCRKLIQDVTGVDTILMRPPRGRVSVPVLLRTRSLGYRLVHWSRTYSDYRQDGTQPLLTRMRAAPPRPQDIVLLHDNNRHTAQALQEILPQWSAQGRRFAKLQAA
jgi:peptidoglycan/xylan/chitin deacetylase (PgdA/CDA1 family)